MPYIFKDSPFDYLNPIPREDYEKAIVWIVFNHYSEKERERRGIGTIINRIKRDLRDGRTILIYKRLEIPKNVENKPEIPKKSTQMDFNFSNSNNNYDTEEKISLKKSKRKTFKEHFLQT